MPNDRKKHYNGHQVIQPDPAVDPYFVVGDDRAERKSGPTVAVAITVNFDLKNGQRERGHAIALHEIPLMRRLYPDGTVTISPKWVPGIDRMRQLSKVEFTDECTRLSQTYRIPAGTSVRDMFADVFGTTPSEQKANLHQGMKLIYEGWRKLAALAKERVIKIHGTTVHPMTMHGLMGDVITTDELEALVRLIEPERETLDDIDVDAIQMDEEQVAPTSPAGATGQQGGSPVEDEAEDPQGDAPDAARLVELLEEAGHTNQTANELAVLAADLPDGIPDTLLVQVEGLRKADGTLNRSKVAKATKIIAAWRQPAPAQA